jgi:hypothetical protein
LLLAHCFLVQNKLCVPVAIYICVCIILDMGKQLCLPCKPKGVYSMSKQDAVQAAPAASSQHANSVFVFTKKANGGAYARMGVGTHNNAAAWAATAACIQANGGKATGAQIMAAIQEAVPYAATNAAPFLRYLQGSMGLLTAGK